MSQVVIEVTGEQDIRKVLQKTKRAVRTGGEELVGTLGLRATLIAKQKAPRGVRSSSTNLASAITFRTSKSAKGPVARVWVKTTNGNARIALANEFGVKPRKYDIDKPQNAALKEWVERRFRGRLTWYLRKNFLVGGPNTRLGKRNKFWKPTYETLREQLPSITANVLGKRIDRAIN